MRAIVSVCAATLFIVAMGCDGGDGSGSGGGGSGASGGSGGAGGTGGGTGGSGGSGGGMGGTGGGMSTGGGGAGGGMGGAGGGMAGAFGATCAVDTDCEMGLVCFNFNMKGPHCTLACTSDADCPAPSSGCNGMGYCKID